MDPTKLDNYRPVSDIPFLGKVLEWVMTSQLQRFLGETDYLNPFQLGLRLGYGMETALVALVDDLHWEVDTGRSLSSFGWQFCPISLGWDLETQFYTGSSPF